MIFDFLHINHIIDILVITTCIILCVNYAIIARHKYKGMKLLPVGLAKKSLFNTMFIFVFLSLFFALVSASFILWSWYLIIIDLILLTISTGWYVFHVSKLRVIYEEIHDHKELARELEKQTVITEEMKNKANELSDPVNKLKEKVYFGVDDDTKPQVIETINEIRQEIIKLSKGLTELQEIALKEK